MCRNKAFLLSRASFSRSDDDEEYVTPPFIVSAQDKIEKGSGAKAGAGDSGTWLRDAGFVDDQALGVSQLVRSNDLLRHHDKSLMDSGHESWNDAFKEYAEATKHGVLIMAVKPEYLRIWASARNSQKEIENIPNGRVHVYIEDEVEYCNVEDGSNCRKQQGYILHMDSRGGEGEISASVYDGMGIIISGREGGYYQGQIKDCKAHGRGKLVRPNGEVYIGDFQNNEQHGEGTYTFANGDVYCGDWVANKCHGNGVLSWVDGDKYEGECKNDKPDGTGKYKFANGDIYEGEYVDGKMHGRGTFRWFNNGEVYEGEYLNDKFHGQGKYTFTNGNVYEGQYKDGMFHGIGKFSWANGSMCHGTWKNGQFCDHS